MRSITKFYLSSINKSSIITFIGLTILLVLQNYFIVLVFKETSPETKISEVFKSYLSMLVISILFTNQILNDKKEGIFNRLLISGKQKQDIFVLKMVESFYISIVGLFVHMIAYYIICLLVNSFDIDYIRLVHYLVTFNFLIHFLLFFLLVFKSIYVGVLFFLFLQVCEKLFIRFYEVEKFVKFFPLSGSMGIENHLWSNVLITLGYMLFFMILNFIKIRKGNFFAK